MTDSLNPIALAFQTSGVLSIFTSQHSGLVVSASVLQYPGVSIYFLCLHLVSSGLNAGYAGRLIGPKGPRMYSIGENAGLDRFFPVKKNAFSIYSSHLCNILKYLHPRSKTPHTGHKSLNCFQTK